MLPFQPPGHIPGFHVPGTTVPIGYVMEQQRLQHEAAVAQANAEAAWWNHRRRSALLVLFPR